LIPVFRAQEEGVINNRIWQFAIHRPRSISSISHYAIQCEMPKGLVISTVEFIQKSRS
jgi:hypothetical protein